MMWAIRPFPQGDLSVTGTDLSGVAGVIGTHVLIDGIRNAKYGSSNR